MATRVKTNNPKNSPGMRLQLGASILSAARGVDTRLVKIRLGRFERTHGNYVTAQRKVDVAESQLRAAQARLAEYDAVQDDAVEALACALVADGQPRETPFEVIGAPLDGALPGGGTGRDEERIGGRADTRAVGDPERRVGGARRNAPDGPPVGGPSGAREGGIADVVAHQTRARHVPGRHPGRA